MSMIVTITVVICLIVATAYITALVCNNSKITSSWQEISYTGSSVEPKEIYICKMCNKKVKVKYCYCPNCGAEMHNGMGRVTYSNKIDLSELGD